MDVRKFRDIVSKLLNLKISDNIEKTQPQRFNNTDEAFAEIKAQSLTS